MKQWMVVLFLLLAGLCQAQGVKEKAENEIQTQLGPDIRLEFEKYMIPPQIKQELQATSQQRFVMDFLYVWKIFRNDTVTGYATLDNVRAKSALMTVLVIFDSAIKIDHVSILNYVGQHGRNVQSKEWLSQFEGKTCESDLMPGSGVDGVSGATYSAAEISKGIKKWCALVRKLAK